MNLVLEILPACCVSHWLRVKSGLNRDLSQQRTVACGQLLSPLQLHKKYRYDDIISQCNVHWVRRKGQQVTCGSAWLWTSWKSAVRSTRKHIRGVENWPLSSVSWHFNTANIKMSCIQNRCWSGRTLYTIRSLLDIKRTKGRVAAWCFFILVSDSQSKCSSLWSNRCVMCEWYFYNIQSERICSTSSVWERTRSDSVSESVKVRWFKESGCWNQTRDQGLRLLPSLFVTKLNFSKWVNLD